MTYQQVSDALSSGAEPAMLCMTCPWDRFCIKPPSMTKAEVDAQIEKAKAEDDAKAEAAKAEGKSAGMPVGMLVTTLAVSGRDTRAEVCPVLAMRLHTEDGQSIVAALRGQMKAMPS